MAGNFGWYLNSQIPLISGVLSIICEREIVGECTDGQDGGARSWVLLAGTELSMRFMIARWGVYS